MNKEKQYYACLLGGAIGDSLGAPYEWVKLTKKIEDFPKKRGTHNIPVGAWTDDTAFTLALGNAILVDKSTRTEEWDKFPNVYLHLFMYEQSVKSGKCVGLGRQTREVLERYAFTFGNSKNYGGTYNSKIGGNGSLMRTTAASIAYFHLPAKQRYRVIEKCSGSTHNSRVCRDACVAFDKVFHQILLGEKDKSKLFDIKVKELTPEIKSIFDEKSFLKKKGIKGTGYVVESLEAVLHCFATTNSYKEAVLKAVNLGGDTDTTAAITGQLAGAYYGLESIPKEWRKKVKGKMDIIKLSKLLSNHNDTISVHKEHS